MANLARAYAITAGKKSEEEDNTVTTADIEKQQQAELSVQSKIDWLKHPVTAEMMQHLVEHEKELIAEAINYCVFPTGGQINVQAVVNNLIRAHAVKSIRKQYGHTSSRS